MAETLERAVPLLVGSNVMRGLAAEEIAHAVLFGLAQDDSAAVPEICHLVFGKTEGGLAVGVDGGKVLIRLGGPIWRLLANASNGTLRTALVAQLCLDPTGILRELSATSPEDLRGFVDLLDSEECERTQFDALRACSALAALICIDRPLEHITEAADWIADRLGDGESGVVALRLRDLTDALRPRVDALEQVARHALQMNQAQLVKLVAAFIRRPREAPEVERFLPYVEQVMPLPAEAADRALAAPGTLQ